MADREVVIVLDDDTSMVRSLQRLLDAHGYDVRGYDTAEEFLENAPLHDARCLVLDINLNGRSGVDLRRHLTRAGSGREGTAKAALEAGCVALLNKPFSAADFSPAVQSAVYGDARAA
jgi:FixJ family two-component response regulator